MSADASIADMTESAARRGAPITLCELRLVFPPCNHAIRRALRSALGALSGLDLDDDPVHAFESALAELLNNIVEHAHADNEAGRVELHLDANRNQLTCTVIDDGVEMPGGTLPAGVDDWDVSSLSDLPEGGFGWFLIRQQVDDLTYSRDDGLNRVSFRLTPHAPE